MKRIIASIKLAPGNRGYFDPLTGMNLSLSNNIGYIREGDNVDNIRRDIKNGKIKIVGGKLPPAVNIEKKQLVAEPVKEEVKKEPKKGFAKEIVKEKKVEAKKDKKKGLPFAKEQQESVVIDVKDKEKLEQASEQTQKDGE